MNKENQNRAENGLTILVWAHSFLEPQFLQLGNGVGTGGLPCPMVEDE